MQRDYCVYKHTSPSGKAYIGITCRAPEERWHGGAGYCRNRYFYNAILKYGWVNFTHEILAENLTHDEACAAEIALIAAYDSTNPARGYNLAPGGHAPVPNGGHYPENAGRSLCNAGVASRAKQQNERGEKPVFR